MTGWVKFHRQALESSVWGHPIRWAVFSYLLLSCNWEPSVNKRYKYTINPGECDHSIRRIAESVGADKDAVQRALVHLQSVGTVRRERRGKVRHAPDVITLVNWALYNGDGELCDTKGDTKANTECDTKGDIIKKKKEAKKKEATPKAPRSKTTSKIDPEGFARFYAMYPRKADPGEAASRWDTLCTEDRQAALEAVPRFAAIWANAPTKELCKTPAVWLNKGAWEFDEADERRKTHGKNGAGGMFTAPKRTDLGPQSSFDSDERQRAIREHEERQTQEVK